MYYESQLEKEVNDDENYLNNVVYGHEELVNIEEELVNNEEKFDEKKLVEEKELVEEDEEEGLIKEKEELVSINEVRFLLIYITCSNFSSTNYKYTF